MARFSWWLRAARHRCICTWNVSHSRCSGTASSAILERRPAPLYTKAPFSRSDIRLGRTVCAASASTLHARPCARRDRRSLVPAALHAVPRAEPRPSGDRGNPADATRRQRGSCRSDREKSGYEVVSAVQVSEVRCRRVLGGRAPSLRECRCGGSRRWPSRPLPRARSAPPQLGGAVGFGSSCGARAGGKGARVTSSLRPRWAPARPRGSLTA